MAGLVHLSNFPEEKSSLNTVLAAAPAVMAAQEAPISSALTQETSFFSIIGSPVSLLHLTYESVIRAPSPAFSVRLSELPEKVVLAPSITRLPLTDFSNRSVTVPLCVMELLTT